MENLKNYYEILGVEIDADTKEILKAYRDCAKKFARKKITLDEFNEVQEAYSILGDEEKKSEYDALLNAEIESLVEAEAATPEEVAPEEAQVEQSEEIEASGSVSNLRVNKGWFKRNRGRIIATGLVIASFIAGLLIGGKKDNNKSNESNNSSIQTTSATTPDELETTVPETTVAPEVTLVLNAETYEEIVNNIVKSNEEKGMPVIDRTVIRSALFITNIDYLTEEDIKAMYGEEEINIVEEINNLYQYVSAVRTHNGQIRNYQIEDFEIDGQRVVEPTTDKYVSLADLAYDPEDKAILMELDAEYRGLVSDIKAGTLTEEEFQASFSYITGFYAGSKELTTNGKSYSIHSATLGGGLLAEAYFPMFGVTYGEVGEYYTSQNATEMQTLITVVDGERFLGGIVNHEILNCLAEEEKTR